jgi:hypothetical protein
VSSAKLRLSAALSGADSVRATVYPVTGSWTEAALTWNTRPGFVASSPLGGFTLTSTTPAWQELDVTSYVKSERAAGRPLVSFAVDCAASSVEKITLSSREGASPPELVVLP